MVESQHNELGCFLHNFQIKNGFYTCINCGFVKNNVVIDNFEPKKYYINGVRIERENLEVLLKHSKRYFNYNESFNQKEKFRKLSFIDSWNSNKFYRHIYPQFRVFESILNLTKSVKQEALNIIFLIRLNNIYFRSYKTLIIASIYYAKKINNDIINLRDICKELDTSFSHTWQIIVKVNKSKLIKIKTQEPNYGKLIDYYIAKLNLDVTIREKAIYVFTTIMKSSIRHKKPSAVAGASLYLVCNQIPNFITQKTISKEMNISEPSIRRYIKAYKNIQQKKSEEKK